MAADDPGTALFGPPPSASAEPDRWGAAPLGGYGGTALLDRPTTRRPVVAPPVGPLPPAPPAQGWDWERSHGLRNALLVAAAILLVGSLTAFVVLRNRDNRGNDREAVVDPPPAIGSTDTTVVPGPPPGEATTVPSIAPVTVVPPAPAPTAAPATTAAPAPPPATAPPPPPTTRAATPPRPTVTASPPYTGGPIPTQRPSTTTTTPAPR